MMKKMLLMLIIAASMMTVAKAAEKYAVLITGDYEAKSFESREALSVEDDDYKFLKELWNDTYLQWELLVDKKGYKPENIIVLYRLGKDYWKELIDAGEATLHERYTPQHLPYIEEGFQITNFPATRKSLEEVNRILREDKQINENDFLYVWTFGHGGSDGVATSYLCMLKDTYWIDPITGEIHQGPWESDDVYDYDFALYFKDLPAKKKVYSMAQCYAGGFEDDLIADQAGASVFFDCAARIDRPAKPADNYAWGVTSYDPERYMERELFGGDTFRHSEFLFHKYGAYAGENPQFQEFYHLGESSYPAVYFYEADGVGYNPSLGYADGIITVEEARRWNFKQNTLIHQTNPESEWPVYSDLCNIGYHTALDYPTLLLNECDDPNSYLFENPLGLNGLIGISQNIVLSPDNELILNNSVTVLLNDRNVFLPENTRFIIKNSSFTGYGFDKTQVKGDDSDFSLINSIGINEASLLLENCVVKDIGIAKSRFSNIYTEGNVVFDNSYLNLVSSELLLSQNTAVDVKNGSEMILSDKTCTGSSNSILNIYDDALLSLNNTDVSNVDIDFFRNHNSVFTGINNFYGSHINLDNSSAVTVTPGSKLVINENSKFTIGSGSVLLLQDGSELVFKEGSIADFDSGSQIVIEGNARVIGNLGETRVAITVLENSSLTIGSGSIIGIRYNESVSLDVKTNSRLIIESDAALNLNPWTQSVFSQGSALTVQSGGSITGYEAKLSGNPVWNGIEAQAYSSVRLTNTSVKNAQIGLSAIGADISVYGSSFVDCYNGVSLTNCPDYRLDDNYFSGMHSGYDYGISLTECGGEIKNNKITNFGRGVVLTLSSTNLVKNKIYNNKLQGVYVTGYNIPQMINSSSSSIELNNEIKNNGASQVNLVYHANMYLNDGYNNIYSDPIDAVPTVPCINTVGWQISTKALLPKIVKINSERNYWGHFDINADNFENFFGVGINSLNEGYNIDFEPYATEAFTSEPGISPKYSSNEPLSPESRQLATAMSLESSGNYKASIKLYERIIERYEDFPEAYVAAARLPYVYLKAEKDTEPLIATYDEALEDENISHKKFYQQMKISTHTKGKKYDEAISIAEVMKNEAQAEEEIMLADISIEIANIMKNANSKAKSNDDQTQFLNKLLAKLHYTDTDDEPVSSPSDITESVLPEATELFQNYPNPFNPVTQIKFALSKTADVKLSVYNISGQLVSQLASGTLNAGVHAVDFDGSRLNSGIYYYTLEVDGNKITKKMVLTK